MTTILGDSSDDKERPGDVQRALLNILEDSDAEKLRLEVTLKAMINILSDSSEEKEQLDDVRRALLNILDDFNIEEDKLRERTSELQAANSELKRSNEELQQFAYVCSHDLQEPLRAVVGFLQLLDKRYKGKLDEKADRWITHSVEGARRMQALINDLLTLSRVETCGIALKATEVSAALNEAQENLRPLIAESNAVITITGHLPRVMADGTQLMQLFQNLIANAIKFRSVEEPRVEISVTFDKEAKQWQFVVRDNGIGFDMEHAERIFIIFQRLQTRTEYPGTGIGLAICKKIIERQGGRIWAESQPGNGAAFFFTLLALK